MEQAFELEDQYGKGTVIADTRDEAELAFRARAKPFDVDGVTIYAHSREQALKLATNGAEHRAKLARDNERIVGQFPADRNVSPRQTFADNTGTAVIRLPVPDDYVPPPIAGSLASSQHFAYRKLQRPGKPFRTRW